MQTLSNGYKLPEDGDKGVTFFPALEDNIQRLNDHTHNGVNSELLSATASEAVTQALLAASWAVQGDGMFRMTVTMPSDIGYDTHNIQHRLTAGGAIVNLSTAKVTATSYYLYSNDDTIDVTAVYT